MKMEPYLFYCPQAPRSNEPQKCDKCFEQVERYFGNEDTTLCIRCFIAFHEEAAIKRENTSVMKKIVNVDWDNPLLCIPPLYVVTFEDETKTELDEKIIKREIRCQKNN